MSFPPFRPLTIAVLAVICLSGAVLASDNPAGAVYVASNAPQGNEILVFDRTVQGSLYPAGSFPTGGNGTGGGLGNQSGLVLSQNGRFLYVVNAGSDSISAFSVGQGEPQWIGTYPSGGVMPVSIAVEQRLLYVVNAGGSANDEDNVAGFRVQRDGALVPIADSSRSLSAASTGPAQAGFSSDGRFLLVTEKATNTISVFAVLDDGTLGPGRPHPSVGTTPFGFDVGGRGDGDDEDENSDEDPDGLAPTRVFVSEAFGGAADSSAVTSYSLDAAGNLLVVDPSVPTTETAACWFVVDNDGRFGYTTNTGSGTLSGFAIGRDGGLELLDPDGVTAVSEGGPIDLDFTRSGRYLYVLNAGAQTLSAFRVRRGDGSLTPIQLVTGLPAGANGLAAR